jgi:hypothetical protein
VDSDLRRHDGGAHRLWVNHSGAKYNTKRRKD